MNPKVTALPSKYTISLGVLGSDSIVLSVL